ncbi:MAG: sulfite exporter TauE/SafE family protein [Ilumatobacteraceae bacterium]
MSRSRWTLMVVLGMTTGFMSGLFGIGGGILMVPGMLFLARFDSRRAHATSLAAMLPMAVSGVVTYVANDTVDWPVVGWLSLGSVFGAFVGTSLLTKLSRRALAVAFSVPLVIAAVRLLFEISGDGRAEITVFTALLITAIGVVTSSIATLLGIGGGIMLVPILTGGFGIPSVISKGSALAVILPTSLVGTLRNRSSALVDFRAALTLGFTGVVMAPVGAIVSNSISAQASNSLFAVLVFVVTARMLWQAATVKN